MHYATKYRNGRLIKVPHRTAWGILAAEVSGLYRKPEKLFRDDGIKALCLAMIAAYAKESKPGSWLIPPVYRAVPKDGEAGHPLIIRVIASSERAKPV